MNTRYITAISNCPSPSAYLVAFSDGGLYRLSFLSGGWHWESIKLPETRV